MIGGAPLLADSTFDVVVAGGGPAGAMAAIAAARRGARVALIERYGFLGGMATSALVLPLQTFHASLEEQIVTGLPQELIDRVVAAGGSPGHVADPLGFAATITPVDPELLKWAYQELCLEAGVQLFLHTIVVGADVRNGRLEGVLAYGKDGFRWFRAPVFIDATGDGDVAIRAGCPFQEGRPGDRLTQPMTLMFRVAGVDVDALLAFMEAHPDDFYLGMPVDRMREHPVIAVSGFFREVAEARRRGELPVPRDRVLLFGMPRRGEVIVNMTRVTHVLGTRTDGLTHGEIEGRRQVIACLDFLRRRIPGFANAQLIQTGTQVGVRETRRIVGEAVLTGRDVVEGRTFPDSVARGAFPIDVHSPSNEALHYIKMAPGTSYDIPYRCLLPQGVDGLIVAGRCLSADHEALASARISATAMALGQAAGTAAVLAVERNCVPREVPIDILQAWLEQDGASWGKGASPMGV